MLFSLVYNAIFERVELGFTTPGLTLQDVYYEDPSRPTVSELEWCWVYGALVLAVRLLLNKYVFSPYAINYLKLRDSKTPPPKKEPYLERQFRELKRATPAEISEMAKKLQWSEVEVSRWFRAKRNSQRLSVVRKFSEALFRFLYYSGTQLFGIYLATKYNWFSDARWCWVDIFETHEIPQEVRVFYFVQLSLYISLVFSQFMDTKRKDFLEMIIHHIVTISLISFSYALGWVRIGTMVLLCHDIGDVLLEGAKVANYARKTRVSDILFALFSVTFIATRLVYFPISVIRATIYDYWSVHGPVHGAHVFQALLVILLILHIFWSYTIVYMVYRVIIVGLLEKDARSESEMSSDDDTVEKKTK